MLNTLPNELVDLILDCLWYLYKQKYEYEEDARQFYDGCLQSCSLVCRSLWALSQVRLFAHVVLEKSSYNGTAIAMSEKFANILQDSPHLSQLVRRLSISNGCINSEDDDDWVSHDKPLKCILPTLRNVTSFSLEWTPLNRRWHGPDNLWPCSMEIQRLMCTLGSTTLLNLDFKGLPDVDTTLFFSAFPSLQNITFSHCQINKRLISSPSIHEKYLSELQSLSIKSDLPLMSWLLRSQFLKGCSKLENLHIDLRFDIDDWDRPLQRTKIWNHLSESNLFAVRHLSLVLFEYWDGDCSENLHIPTDPANLTIFPNLRSLALWVCISYDVSDRLPDDAAITVHQFLSKHHKSLKGQLTNLHLTVEMQASPSIRETTRLQNLDKWVTEPQNFPSLTAVEILLICSLGWNTVEAVSGFQASFPQLMKKEMLRVSAIEIECPEYD